MTQKSYPWPGVAPTSGDDAGRYTAQEWNAVWAAVMQAGGVIKISPALRTLAGLANVGVFYSVGNRLAVTSPGANRVNVNTGAALACGKFFYNDTSVGSAGNITSPAANPRIDRVVVRVNFGAADYVPANAAAADFTVPAYTARITVIHGAEAAMPTPPALTQDATLVTYWDIQLYQYQISVAGAISAITDERNWADIEAKVAYIQVENGYDFTAVAPIVADITGHMILADNARCKGFGSFRCPQDYLSDGAINVLLYPAASGDVVQATAVSYGALGAAINEHSDSQNSTETVVITTIEEMPDVALTTGPVAAGDFIFIDFERDSTGGGDTVNAAVTLVGFTFTYWAWK